MVSTIIILSRLVKANTIIPLSCAAMPSRDANWNRMRSTISDGQASHSKHHIRVHHRWNQPRFKQQIVRFSRASLENCLSNLTFAGTCVCISFDEGIRLCSLAARNPCTCLCTNPDDVKCSCANPICLPGDSCSDFNDVIASLGLPSSQWFCDASVNTGKNGLTGTQYKTNDHYWADDHCSGVHACLANEDFEAANVMLCSDAHIFCLCVPTVSDVSCDCDNQKCTYGEVCIAWRGVSLSVPPAIDTFF